MKKSALLILILTASAMLSFQNKTDLKNGELKVMAEPQNKNNPYYSRTDTAKLNLPDSVWKEVLPDNVYQIARNKNTERAFTGKYWEDTGIGTYYCAACGNPLFKSNSWFASSCGWPSFFETIKTGSVVYKTNISHGMNRTEVLCSRCDAHLGHIFDDGPPPTGKRYCMNSIVLDFEPDKK